MTIMASRVDAAQVTPAVLGSVVWFSVSGEASRDETGRRVTKPLQVTLDDLRVWFAEIGLDEAFLPVRISAANAFRSASSKIACEYELPVHGQRAVLRVVDYGRDPEQIVRHVVRDTYDEARKKQSTDKIGELRFTRGRRTSKGRVPGSERHRTIVRANLPQADHDKLVQQFADFEDRYSRLQDYRDEDDMRTILREYLRANNAVVIEPSKGIYFLTVDQQQIASRLTEFVRRLGGGCSFTSLPLLDGESGRAMLQAAFEEQVDDEVRLLGRDVDKYLEATQGPTAAAKYGEFKDRWELIEARVAHMKDFLDRPLVRADSVLEAARQQILVVNQRIRDRKPRRR